MKLIYLLCQKISLSQTIFSRGFRIKYNLGGEKKKKTHAQQIQTILRKNWRHHFHLHIGNVSLR